jgi:integrase
MVGPKVMKPYKYTHQFRDRHGRVRWYYRRHGKQRPIPFEPGTAEFQRVYDALNGSSDPTTTTSDRPENVNSGTWRWLCVRYFASMDFEQLDPETQRVRRRTLESTCEEPWEPGSSKTFGNAPIAAMTPHALAVLRDRKKGLPEAQRGRLKAISRVFDWAMRPENKITGIASNPAKVVQRPKENPDGGFHSWTPDEVAQFEERHPIGTKARLALALFLFTGQRKSDVVLFGRQHSKAGVLTFTQRKNRNRRPVKLELPVLPILQSIIDASSCGDLTFLVTEFGKPFSAKGFGAKFRAWCDEASLPHCTAHGLRKAGAVIAAHNGATPHQLMAIFGWRTLKEAERYTKAAEQKRIAAIAMPLLIAGRRENESG